MTQEQRRYVETLLRNQPGLSNVAIGKLARVSEGQVRRMRQEVAK